MESRVKGYQQQRVFSQKIVITNNMGHPWNGMSPRLEYSIIPC